MMMQAFDPHFAFNFPDYDHTLAIELSEKSWVLSAQVPGLLRVKAKRTIEPTRDALSAAIQGYRERAKVAGQHVERMIATYEAGWSGFCGVLVGETRD
jgi:transposase